MCLLLFIRLLVVLNLLHIGIEAFKCTTNENDKTLKAKNRWSSWTDWSPCTRPCGIGIQHRNRTCLLTRRKRRKSCIGSASVVRVCNTQECGGDRQDLLSEQCSTFNNRTFAGRSYIWLPFLHLGRECSLHCRPQGERFFAELSPVVADGTPCGKKSYCYQGRCLEAGCNDILGNDGKTDCEMCDGRNISYRRIAGIFTRPNLSKGYNYITTIPSKAVNITISQLKTSNNHLALRKSDGSYIINGIWNINEPGQYINCGTTFTYRKETLPNSELREQIFSPGPLLEPIQLMLMTLQINSGIKYEYDIPVSDGTMINMLDSIDDAAFQSKNSFIQQRAHYTANETINSSSYEEPMASRRRHRKKHFNWKICYKSCSDGGVYRSFVCVRHSNEMIVPDHRCSTIEKPFQDDLKCNTTKSCLPEWVSTEWSPCSATCGEGFQKREVMCKKLTTGYPIIVPNEACSSPFPSTIQKCDLKPCDVAISSFSKGWEVGTWSKCSTSCGPGFRSRQVTCKSNLCPINSAPPSKEPCNSICKIETGIWLTSQWNVDCPESCGSGWQMRNVICFGGGECSRTERPDIYRACSSDRSCTGQWFEGPWQKCTGVCQSGEQRRDVICMAKVHNQFLVVSDSNCSPEKKPISVQRCQLPPCLASWYTTEWSSCSSPCGGGIQYREVFCIKDSTESSLCPAEEKPTNSQPCNNHSCSNLIEGSECEDKHKYCQTAVVQARLCLYQYYRTLCCQACFNKV